MERKSTQDKRKVNRWDNIRTIEGDDLTEPSSDEQLHGIFQVGGKSPKFMATVIINGVSIEMEIDTGAEHSTIPIASYKDKLATVCTIVPSQVTLQQYDQSPLIAR